MMQLIIARHGNTFAPHEVPRRIGCRTDLPLVNKGEDQAKALGHYLQSHHLVPDIVYTSQLLRTKQTASLALSTLNKSLAIKVQALDIFNEIDYGPDENLPETDVISRIGYDSLRLWEEQGVMPQGWKGDVSRIIENWHNFASECLLSSHRITLIVTSNGIARFAPYITGNFEKFRKHYPLKLAPGALGIVNFVNNGWQVDAWNIRP